MSYFRLNPEGVGEAKLHPFPDLQEGCQIHETGDTKDIEKTAEDIGHHGFKSPKVAVRRKDRNRIVFQSRKAKDMPSGFPWAAFTHPPWNRH